MISASSPLAYPQSSSPPPVKRPRQQETADLRNPKAVSGFLIEDDTDEEDDLVREEPVPKRRMLDDERSVGSKARETEAGHLDLMKRDAARPTTTNILDLLSKSGHDTQDSSTEEHQSTTDTTPEPESLEKIQQALPTFLGGRAFKMIEAETSDGKIVSIGNRKKSAAIPFEQMVAARSTTKVNRAKKSYYGIDIHTLIEEASMENLEDQSRKEKAPVVIPSTEKDTVKQRPRRTLMWTEKYRARHFMELVGDDRTHRQVLRWLKAWDPLVFPKAGKNKPVTSKRPGGEPEEEKAHKKILLLTGPPGLGKTTLAHVCARQAGYEVMEINASDERSRDVVKGRIRTSVGTESVKTGSTITSKSGHVQKIAHPLCVVVDEVDGVVGGSGGSGEGGFIKALIDLILLDQKNTAPTPNASGYAKKKKKGDDFKLMRPLILICNDVYHPSLRPLRQSNFAEIIHVRKPPLDAVVGRMKSVFEKEGVACDSDAVRRLCEATWGVSAMESRRGREGTGEGDLRGIMVVGEWAAGKLKASTKDGKARLTRKWVEQNMMSDLSYGGGGARGVGRGGAKEVVNRVFLEGAGFPASTNISDAHLPGKHANEGPKSKLGVAELAKKAGMDRLREMVDTSGEVDKIITDIFTDYPNQPFNDDNILSKPDAAYEWLAFHDKCSSRVFTHQDFELAPYLCQPVLACHHLFASPARHHFNQSNGEGKKWGQNEEEEEPLPFSGPRADFSAHEAEKENKATILALQSSLNSTLLRSFRSPESIAVDLIPYLVRMLTPEVKPIIVGGSGEQRGIASVRKEGEKAMVKRAVDIMGTVGVIFERGKLEGDGGGNVRAAQWVYRMEPPLDTLAAFETAAISTTGIIAAPVRYGVRQVLDQEYKKNIIVRESLVRQARYRAGNPDSVDHPLLQQEQQTKKVLVLDDSVSTVKRDFFGREIRKAAPLGEVDGNRNSGEGGPSGDAKKEHKGKDDNKVWVSYHEGFSNAVKKPITIEELLRGL